MNKKDILKVLDLVAFILIFIATGLVLIFEISGDLDLIYLAVITFFIGVCALDILLVVRLVASFKEGAGQTTPEGVAPTAEGELVQKKSKKQKILLFIELGFGILAFIIILIALINF